MSTPYGGPPAPPDDGAATIPDGAQITEIERPLWQRLTQDSELHNKIKSAITSRLDLSYKHVSQRYDTWDRIDEKCRLFFDLSRKAKRGDGSSDATAREMPFGRSIVMPASFAIADVRRAQMLSLALARDPIHQLEGTGPEDVKPAKAIEATLAYDAVQSKLPLELLSFYQDADKYGVGILYDTWEVEKGHVFGPAPITKIPMAQLMPEAIGRKLFPTLYQRTKDWGTVRQFNRTCAVDPFNWWPDPRGPVSQVQSAEFQGHRTYSGWSYFEARQLKRGDGVYFNIEKLKDLSPAQSVRGGTSQAQAQRARSRFSGPEFALQNSGDDRDRGFYASDHFQIRLIPREWQLGPDDRPEIWWFELVEEQLVVRAHPCPYEHGRFTYSVGETVPDTHALFNPGVIELLDGPQRFIDWLFNARYQNVVRMMNNRIVFDPRFVSRDDIENPFPGRPIELTLDGQALLDAGFDPRKFIFPVPVQDVTGELYKDVEYLFEMMQRQSAAADPAMSVPTQDERTLGENRMIAAGSSQRLGQNVRMLDAMAIEPMVSRQVSNRQQFTDAAMYYRIGGDDAAKILGSQDGRALISPSDLQGNFDYRPITGTMPPDPARNAETWSQILQMVMGAAPQLMQLAQVTGKIPDLVKIMEETVKALGVKNGDDFWMPFPPQPPMMPDQILPDEQVQAGVQSGNMVPVQ